jgi:cation-transporting P-type ATPase E
VTSAQSDPLATGILEVGGGVTGLSSEQVAERVRENAINDVPVAPTRTVGQILRANVLTPFNALLGGLLAVILVVGPIQDALFGLVLIANSTVGIIQELRAKRTLDRLALLTAPRANILRAGRVSDHPVQEVVLDDVLSLRPGDQVVVDGVVLHAAGLELDESLLTGESEPVSKGVDDEVLSGSFVAAGSGLFRATRVGAGAYASQLAEDARRFTLVTSELRSGINRVIKLVGWAMLPTAAVLLYSQFNASSGIAAALCIRVGSGPSRPQARSGAGAAGSRDTRSSRRHLSRQDGDNHLRRLGRDRTPANW